MSKTISNQINKLIKDLDMNFTSFSKRIGITNNVTISRIVSENRNPSFEVLEKILISYPKLNANWLMLGKGKMWLKNHDNEELSLIANPETNKTNPDKNGLNKNTEMLLEMIEAYKGQIDSQQETIYALKETNSLLRKVYSENN